MLTLAVPVFALQLVDAVLPAGSTSLLLSLAGILAVLLASTLALDMCRGVVLLRAGLWFEHVAGQQLVEGGIGHGLGGQALKERGEAAAIVGSELRSPRLAAALELPWAIATSLLLCLLNPLLGLACMATLGCALLCLLAARTGGGRKPENRASAQWLEALCQPQAQAAGSPQAAGAARIWETANRARIGQGYAQGHRQALLGALARTAKPAGLCAVLCAGGYLAVLGQLAAGEMIAAALIAARALSLIEQTVNAAPSLRRAWLAWRTIKAAASERVAVAPGNVSPVGQIEIAAATSAYPGQQRPALISASLTIAPGQCIGIIGPSGAGKSTLAATIAGVLRPTAGKAEIDGMPISLCVRTALRRPIGYLPDSPTLLPGTIAQNIAGFAECSEAEVATAAALASLDATTAALSTDAGALSMREQRTVALARALFGSPRVIVLDEPELGLDAAAVVRLRDLLAALRAQGTGIVIATREVQLLGLTDHIVMMSQGRIEAVVASRDVMRSEVDANAATGRASELRHAA